MSNKKRILTGHVSRVINGIPVILSPGDPAPDWVTNPALISTEIHPSTLAEADVEIGKLTLGVTSDPTSDELDALGIKDLRNLAEEAGVAKSGSKKEIADRLRAKRVDETPAGDDDERVVLLKKAEALGIEDADDLTDVELQAITDTEE